MDRPVTPRRELRKPVTLPAQCRTITGMRDDGYVSDITAQGCCITTRGIMFLVGARVSIKPKGLEALSGVIRWIEGHRAGVEFDAPLYAPIVDHLVKQHSAGRPVTIASHY